MSEQATHHAYSMGSNCEIEGHGVAQVLQFLQAQPETLHVQDLRNDPTYQTVDVDLAWLRKAGPRVAASTLEVKVCLPYRTTNFFLEIISNLSKLTPGGMIYSFADYFVFLFYYRKELYLIPADGLRVWLLQNWDAIATRETQTSIRGEEAYKTVGKMVPEADVLAIPGVIKHTLEYELHPQALARIQPPTEASGQGAICSCCAAPISAKVAAYSEEKFARPLCMQCQRQGPPPTTGQP